MQKKLVLMTGLLAVLISSAVIMTGCPQKAKDEKKTGLEVQPTGEADPYLKGTQWGVQGGSDLIDFSDKGNIALIDGMAAIYTVENLTISFDLSSYISGCKNITAEQLIQSVKEGLTRQIKEIKEEIDKTDEKTDPEKKKNLEERLKFMEADLEKANNPTEEYKQRFSRDAAVVKKVGAALEPFAKFTGTFNADKTVLTIEKMPEYDFPKGAVSVSRVTFTKR